MLDIQNPKCIFVNQLKTRPGAARDHETLEAAFEFLGYTLDIHTDITADGILEMIKEEDFSECDVLILCIAGHGGAAGSLECAEKSEILFTDIYRALEACPDLKGKPKLLFENSCRPGPDGGATSNTPVPVPPIFADFIISRATTNGRPAFRCDKTGTVFFQAVAEELCQIRTRCDVHTLMRAVRTKVKNAVAQKSPELVQISPTTEYITQRICFVSRAAPPLCPRPYQQEAIDQATRGNTIVHLPTGKGKTLIAIHVAKHFLTANPQSLVIVVGPTKVIVNQLVDEFMRELGVDVGTVCGPNVDNWNRQKWRDACSCYPVLCGTPQVFANALGIHIQPSKVSLMIFDECHNAVGNSPMVCILNDRLLEGERRPHILGLTASFNAGRDTKLRQKKMNLEKMFQAEFFVPNLDDVPTVQRDMFPLPYRMTTDPAACGLVEDFVREIWNYCREQNIVVTDMKKKTGSAKKCYLELGRQGVYYFIKFGIVELIRRNHASKQERGLNPRAGRGSSAAFIKFADQALSVMPSPHISNKVVVALECLRKELKAGGRGIVFVDRIALSLALMHVINDELRETFGEVAAAISGSVNKTILSSTVEQFRSGALRVLVSTAVLEEGLDVPQCTFVIRFSEIHTAKQHIQGSGRARSEHSKVYYMENAHEALEAAKERQESVARLSSCDVEARRVYRRAELARQSQFLSHVTPYTANGVIAKYCAKCGVVRARKEELDGRLILLGVPSPDGELVVTEKDEDVIREYDLNTNRTENWDHKKTHSNVMFYVMFLKLVERNFLDPHTATPPADVVRKAKAACLGMFDCASPECEDDEPSVSPMDYGEASDDSEPPLAQVDMSAPLDEMPPLVRASFSPSPSPSPGTPTAHDINALFRVSRTPSPKPHENPTSKLKELGDMGRVTPPVYKEDQQANLTWVAHVKVGRSGDEPETFSSPPCGKKKEARKAAAQIALAALQL